MEHIQGSLVMIIPMKFTKYLCESIFDMHWKFVNSNEKIDQIRLSMTDTINYDMKIIW